MQAGREIYKRYEILGRKWEFRAQVQMIPRIRVAFFYLKAGTKKKKEMGRSWRLLPTGAQIFSSVQFVLYFM